MRAVSRYSFLLSLLAVVFLFWGVRIHYWTSNSELPFSDMADYESIARGIVADFRFDFNSYWKSYCTPTLPLMRAIAMYCFGDSLWVWQIFQSSFLFVALVWLAFELYKLSASRWLALSLVATVALSRPSIFWSYKMAREGLAEAFIYLVSAALLLALRKKRPGYFFMVGCVLAAAILNRANTLLVFPILVALFVVLRWSGRDRLISIVGERPYRALIGLILGAALVWSPWVIRSVRLYGAPVVLTTQAPFVFFWEFGDVTLLTKNGPITFSTNSLQNEAPRKFANDYLAYKHAQGLVRLWLQANWRSLPQLLLQRVWNSIVDRSEYLTKLPRQQLFGPRRDLPLLDKQILVFTVGLLGLFIGALVIHPFMLVAAICALAPWLNGVLMLGYPRMLEPSLPLIFFGNAMLIYAVATRFATRRSAGTSSTVAAGAQW